MEEAVRENFAEAGSTFFPAEKHGYCIFSWVARKRKPYIFPLGYISGVVHVVVCINNFSLFAFVSPKRKLFISEFPYFPCARLNGGKAAQISTSKI